MSKFFFSVQIFYYTMQKKTTLIFFVIFQDCGRNILCYVHCNRLSLFFMSCFGPSFHPKAFWGAGVFNFVLCWRCKMIRIAYFTHSIKQFGYEINIMVEDVVLIPFQIPPKIGLQAKLRCKSCCYKRKLNRLNIEIFPNYQLF